ncbi:MAG: PD40 domain-containing protein [Anaerolineae bacterium]|nr:PD40 domain-containing protein [Anaerolineae bacterium]
MQQLFIIAWLIILGGAQVRAAEPSQAMILLRRENPAVWSSRYGNLYTYTPGDKVPKQLTTSGNITAPALSPDGTTIAYAAIAESVLVDAASGQHTFSPDAEDPLDIWLMDRDTHHFTHIADQPDKKAPVYRSSPIWSPDSQQLAWFTFDGSAQGGSVVVYDRVTQKSTLLANGLLMTMNDGGNFNLPNLGNYSGTLFSLIFQNMSIEFGTKSDEVSLRCLR